MTRSDALAALIEKVEAGTAEGRLGNDDFWKAFPGITGSDAYGAYRGDLNDAVAFMEKVLPGWGWCVSSDSDGVVVIVGRASSVSGDVVKAPNNPARALLLAALRALAAQEAEE